LGGTPRYRVSKWSRDMEKIEEVLRSLETKVDRMMEMLKDMQDNTGVTIVIDNNLSIFCIEAAEGGNT
jgi:translation initiation factor 2 alpha subunit (eIF-2alpha)